MLSQAGATHCGGGAALPLASALPVMGPPLKLAAGCPAVRVSEVGDGAALAGPAGRASDIATAAAATSNVRMRRIGSFLLAPCPAARGYLVRTPPRRPVLRKAAPPPTPPPRGPRGRGRRRGPRAGREGRRGRRRCPARWRRCGPAR